MHPILAACLIAPALALADPPADSRPAPLSGPSTAPSHVDARPTLVRRDFNGKVVRLERTLEEAAADLLNLDEAARARITEIMAKRTRILDDFVARNTDLLTKFGQAAATGNKADTIGLLNEAFNKLRELRRDGSLESQFAAVLSAEQVREFKAHIAAYFDAVVAERQANPDEGEMDKDGNRKPPGRIAIVIDERLKAFGKEIERAFYRSIYSGELLYQKIGEIIPLRDDQAAKIRAWCAEFAEKGGQSPTEEQKRELFLRVLSVLDIDQAAKAVKYLKKNP